MEWMQWTVWESLAFTSTCPCSNSIQCRATIFQNIPSSNICLIILHLYCISYTSANQSCHRESLLEIESQSEIRNHTSVKGHVFTTILFWVFTLGLLKAPTPKKTIKILIFKVKEYFNLFSRFDFFSAPKNKSERLLRCVKMYRSTRWFLVYISSYFPSWCSYKESSFLPLFDHL